MNLESNINNNDSICNKNNYIYDINKEQQEIENEIDKIVEKICYNIFISLYSEVSNDVDIQEYYESFIKETEISKSDDVITNETNSFNKELLESYQKEIGLINKGESLNINNIPILFNSSKIIKKIKKILKVQKKINEMKENTKEIYRKILMEDEKEEIDYDDNKVKSSLKIKNQDKFYSDMVERFIVDSDYYQYTLSLLFENGAFCKDIMSLNNMKCNIISSRNILIEICQFILTICQSHLINISKRLKFDIKENEKLKKYKECDEINLFQLLNNNCESLDKFFGVREEKRDHKNELIKSVKDSGVDIAETVALNSEKNSDILKDNDSNKCITSGYNISKEMMKKQWDELIKVIDPKDLLKLNIEFMNNFKIVLQNHNYKYEKELIINNDHSDNFSYKNDKIGNIFQINTNLNRSTINGSQKNNFIVNAIAISLLMKILNQFKFRDFYTKEKDNNTINDEIDGNEKNENNYVDKDISTITSISEKILQMNDTYICFCLAGILTVTKALKDRSEFQRKNLATETEVNFIINLLGINDINKYLKIINNKNRHFSEDIPIFCYLLRNNGNYVKNDKNISNPNEKDNDNNYLCSLLNYNDDDLQILISLFIRMNEEYQKYSIVRYSKSDQLDNYKSGSREIEEKSLFFNEAIRYLMVGFLLIFFHYVFFNLYQNSPFNIFTKKN